MTLDESQLATARQRLAFPLDYPTLEAARVGAERVKASMGVLKVGLELFVAEGPAAVALGSELGMSVFLDLKLHDIPATVERAVASACQLGASYLTLHAAGGPRMLEAASNRASRENTGLCLLAVTVLTSLDADDLARVGVQATPAAQAERLGKLAVDCGIGGLVCSPAEVGKLRSQLGPRPVLVTPGIRPSGSEVGDQKRVGTPTEAIQNGSSMLVVGRPVRDAADPERAALGLATEVAAALSAGARAQ
ncbi:MAG: orotidine-5'-phosphate decarboxylase [Polyangiaceae bacterium]